MRYYLIEQAGIATKLITTNRDLKESPFEGATMTETDVSARNSLVKDTSTVEEEVYYQVISL